MSRWWRDLLSAELGPHTVRLARYPAWPRGGARARADYGVEGGAAPGTDAVCATLAGALAERRWRGCNVDVLLHGQFVRWLLLPFSEAIATDAERLAHARAEFEGIHGERVRGWTVRIADAAAGEPAPACAIDTGFLDELRRVCAAADGQVRSVMPAFARELDSRRALLRSPVSGFAQAESGRLNLAVLEKGRFAALESSRHTAALADTLEAWLSRVDAAGVAPGLPRRVWVTGDDVTGGLPARLGDWDVVSLQGGAAAAVPRVAGRFRVARG